MITAIDTNILFDVLLPDPDFAATSESLIDASLAEGSVIVSEPVFAELAARFPDRSSLEAFLTRTGIRLEPSTAASLYAAGVAWAQYSRNRPSGLACANCGSSESVHCQNCGKEMQVRQHVLGDFLIGAHAQTQADRLLTRDRGYFRTYYPNLTLG